MKRKKVKLKVKKIKMTERELLKSKMAGYLVKGLDLNDVCKLLDITEATVDRLRCDVDFDDFISKCLAKNELRHLDVIEEAGKSGYWQASAWYLERKFPNKYGKKDVLRHEYDIKIGTFQQVVIGVLDKIDPRLKFQVLSELRNYKFNGSEVMNRTQYLDTKLLPPPEVTEE